MGDEAMDASGVVRQPIPGYPNGGSGMIWRDLSPFAQGYVRAALTDSPDRRILTPDQFDDRCWRRVGFSDLAPEALAEILKDCEAYGRYFMGVKPSENGLAFWENRQRGYLLDVAHCGNFPPLTIILAEDGKIHLKAADNG